MWWYVQGLFCFCFLVLASWCVGEGGEILGKKYDASIIGGLVIAWLNTAPEAIFFITALESDNPRFAIGAVSGSTIVVCTIALGACLWIGTRARSSGNVTLQPSVKNQCWVLLVSVLIPISTVLVGFQNWIGFFGLGFYVWFLFYSLQGNQLENSKEHDLEVGMEDDHHEEEEDDEPTWKGVSFLVAGGLLIVLFSSPFINSIVEIANDLRVNPILLAFFFAPIASEAPEILESISLSRKGNSQNINIAYSNLIGGTITKTTLLSGILCFYGVSRGFEWEYPNYNASIILLSLSSVAAAAIGIGFLKQSSNHAVCLFLIFLFTGVIQYNLNSGSIDDPQATTFGVVIP